MNLLPRQNSLDSDMKIMVGSDPLPVISHGFSSTQSFHDLLRLLMHGEIPQGPGRSMIILELHKVAHHAGLEDHSSSLSM